jgi:hypothetical protein
MEILLIIEIILLILVVGYMTYEYSMKSVSIYIKLIVLFSWIVSFSYLNIVPLDIYYVIINNNNKRH